MSDPTNAQLRDFDIPVVMPRFAFKELPPPSPDAVAQTPVTTVTCTQPAAAPAPDAAAATPLVASKSVAAPVVRLGLPATSRRRRSDLLGDGLRFAILSDKAASDVEVRLLQLLPGGVKRPLGVDLVIAPGKRAVEVVVLPTPFARAKLKLASKHRAVRAIAIVTAQDGSVGQAHADFTLTG